MRHFVYVLDCYVVKRRSIMSKTSEPDFFCVTWEGKRRFAEFLKTK